MRFALDDFHITELCCGVFNSTGAQQGDAACASGNGTPRSVGFGAMGSDSNACQILHAIVVLCIKVAQFSMHKNEAMPDFMAWLLTE